MMGSKRTYLLLHLLLLAGMAGAQQKPFTLNGTVKGKTGVLVYLRYTTDDGVKSISKKDSSRIGNGQFSFNGQLNRPAEAFLSMDVNTAAIMVNYSLLITHHS